MDEKYLALSEAIRDGDENEAVNAAQAHYGGRSRDQNDST
jgi:DNA-binding FadR family transcriptional regulator